MARSKKDDPNRADGQKLQRKPGNPIPKWPEKLDFDKARRVLFPDDAGDDDFPRMNWSAGQRPPFIDEDVPNELDECISEYKKSNLRKFQFLSQEELSKNGISCPYFEARLGVLQAVKYAILEHRRAPHVRSDKSKLDALKKLSDFRFYDLERCLIGFRNEINTKREYAKTFETAIREYEKSRYGAAHEWLSTDGVWRDQLAQWQDIDAAVQLLVSNIGDLAFREEQNRHALSAMIEHQYDPGKPEKKIEAHAFVQYLGFVWFDLTGKNPSKTADSPFVHFVASAWQSLARGLFRIPPAEPSWNSVCREAITSFEKLQEKLPLFCWARSSRGLLPKYRFSGTEPLATGLHEADDVVYVEDITTDDDVISGVAPFDLALLSGRLSIIPLSKPDPEFLRLEKLMDAGELSSADLTAGQVKLFHQERLRRSPSITLADPRTLTPLELRRREIWRAEALDEWRRTASDWRMASSQTLAATIQISAALKHWRGPATRLFTKTLSEKETQRFGVVFAEAQSIVVDASLSIFDAIAVTPATKAQAENWLKPRSILNRRN